MTPGGYWQQSGGIPPQPGPAPRPGSAKDSRNRLIIAVAAAAVAVVAVFAAAFYAFSTETVVGHPIAGEKPGTSTTTTTTTTTATATVAAGDLPSLLSSPAEVSQLTGVGGLSLGKIYSGPDTPSPGIVYAPAECISAMFSGMSQIFGSSGYESVYQTRVTNSAAGTGQILIDQGVALYADHAAAQRVFDGYRALWQRCGTGFSRTSSGVTTAMTVTPPFDAGNGMLGMTIVQPDDSNEAVDRTIAVKGAVIVDCQSISIPALGKVSAVARRILDRIPN